MLLWVVDLYGALALSHLLPRWLFVRLAKNLIRYESNPIG